MLHPFDDARLSVERARDHINEFESRIHSFIAGDPWTLVVERQADRPNYVYKLRFAEGIDRRIKLPIADALRNLRSALDHLTAACARLNGACRSTKLQFPFLRDPKDWEREIRRKCRFVPPEVVALFWKLSPYPGGDDELWELAQLRNENEHWALSKIELSVGAVAFSRRGQGQQIISFAPWPASGINEIELFTAARPETNFSCSLVVEMGFVEGASAFVGTPDGVLQNVAKKVLNIIDDTESVMRRIGFASHFP